MGNGREAKYCEIVPRQNCCLAPIPIPAEISLERSLLFFLYSENGPFRTSREDAKSRRKADKTQDIRPVLIMRGGRQPLGESVPKV